jgi:hypothetical protein
MKNTTQKPGGWSTVRHQLATWEKPALLALVKDLYETAGVNQDFVGDVVGQLEEELGVRQHD